MANFKPLKDYILYALDQLIDDYGIEPPFLDVGCGVGDVSLHLAGKNWNGLAIDDSEDALRRARENLSSFSGISVVHGTLLDQHDYYNSILLLDVLEHIHDDRAALEKISSLILPEGHLVIVTPSNPKEWRWDDDFYGHYRRYSLENLVKMLRGVDLHVIISWDVTYPVYWLMRRVYTKLLSSKMNGDNISDKTRLSSLNSAWDSPLSSNSFFGHVFIWNMINKFQFRFFKNDVHRGHEVLILARKGA